MLLDTWYGKGNKKLLLFDVQSPIISRTLAETIVGELMIQGYLKEDFHYTPYSTISYIKKGINTFNCDYLVFNLNLYLKKVQIILK